MDWQRLVADVAKEKVPADEQTIDVLRYQGLDVDGSLLIPAYREIVVTVMRQCGKTTLVLSVECEELWKPNHRVAYTAQTGSDGRQKFVEDQIPLLQDSALWRDGKTSGKIRQFFKAADNTGMWWWNGSRLKVLNVGQSPGHGKTLDMAVLDETFKDTDDSREGALRPAMRTKPLAQIWNVSTAGTPASTFLRRKVELGRAAVKANKRQGLAYFEWSIPEDEDVYSPSVWAKYIPAYGLTITEAVLMSDAATMSENEFRRTTGNQWTETEDRIIPADWWNQVSSPGEDFASDMYAIDALQDRSSSAVCKADRDGNLRLVAQRPGTGWLVEAFQETMPDAKIKVARNGPLAPVGEDMERAGLTVEWADAHEEKSACLRFYDDVADRKMRVRRDDRFDQAVAAAARRADGDMWKWNRDAPGADILMAASLAYNAALDSEPNYLF